VEIYRLKQENAIIESVKQLPLMCETSGYITVQLDVAADFHLLWLR